MMKVRHWLSCLLLSMCASYASANSVPPPNTPQGLEGGFWRIDGNFDATLRLKNILLKQSLVVTPSLYFADGTEYRLPPVTLSPAGIGRVSLRYALQSAPAAIRSHISTFGMAAISYQWSWPAVIASIQATDEIASLTSVSSFQADMRQVHAPVEPATPQITRGTWWLPTDNADYFVALGNSSLTTKTVQIVISGHDGKTLADTQVTLNKHAVQLLHLSDILGQLNAPDKLGGIEIHYSGAQRSVVSYAAIEDESVGYSASPFLIEDRPLPARPDHVATISAPGIMLGRPDPAMLFPNGTVFSPFAILHNVSNHALVVNMSLDTQASAGAPQTRSLNPVNLAPGETLRYDLNSQFTQDNPLPDGYGTLSASFNGQDGDLRVQAGSIDQSQSYVFEAPASLQAETASRTLCFWSLEGDNDTMVAVWNYKAVAQDLVLTLHYATGQYLLPIHLEPRQAYNLDLMSLVRSRVPDPTGALIPSNIDSGSAVLSSARGELDRISVSVATSVFNVRNATCGYGCVSCNGVVSVVYSTTPMHVPVTRTTSSNIQLTMGSGTVIENPSGTWHTSNQAIATVNSNGIHTGVGVGTTASTFIVQNVPVNATICGPAGSVTCPTETITANAPVYVQPVVFTVTPLNVTLGQTGSFMVTGQGFASAGALTGQVSGNDIQAGSTSGLTDTVAYIPYTVQCDASVGPFGELSVTFSNGDGGSALTLPFPLSVGLPSPPTPSIQFSGQTVSGTQPVVVGQQIALSGSQSLPRCMSLQQQQWTPPTGGNPIGGYTNAAGTGIPDTTGGVVQPLPQGNTRSFTFYFVTPGTFATNYQYSMSATDANGKTVSTGLGPPATATFNVSGPSAATMQVTFGPLQPQLFNTASPPRFGVGTTTLTGITFEATDQPGSPSGQFSFAQTINTQLTTRIDSVQGTCYETTGTGLDTVYPYGNASTGPNFATTNDDPYTNFYVTDEEIITTEKFTMYALWTPSVTPSIPVPIGSINWQWYADAVQTSNISPYRWGWNPNSNVANPTSSAASFSPGTTYPQWTTYGYSGTHPCNP